MKLYYLPQRFLKSLSSTSEREVCKRTVLVNQSSNFQQLCTLISITKDRDTEEFKFVTYFPSKQTRKPTPSLYLFPMLNSAVHIVDNLKPIWDFTFFFLLKKCQVTFQHFSCNIKLLWKCINHVRSAGFIKEPNLVCWIKVHVCTYTPNKYICTCILYLFIHTCTRYFKTIW